MRRYRTYDEYLDEVLRDPTDAAMYLTAAAEYNDPPFLLDALASVARAHGLSAMAKRISLSRMGLYKSLSRSGNPQLKTFMGILKAAGIQLAFNPIAQKNRRNSGGIRRRRADRTLARGA